jgi:hypothetical protein
MRGARGEGKGEVGVHPCDGVWVSNSARGSGEAKVYERHEGMPGWPGGTKGK